jgi:UDPglucose 6-dehydrogenase
MVLILGWAFKKNTNDTRESASIYVANNLINHETGIDVYDPKVIEKQIDSDLSHLNPNYNKSLVNFVEEPFLNISNYNIITIMTEWDEFVHYDWKNIYKKMKKPAFIFDGRNILEIEKIKKIGFNYIGLGRK